MWRAWKAASVSPGLRLVVTVSAPDAQGQEVVRLLPLGVASPTFLSCRVTQDWTLSPFWCFVLAGSLVVPVVEIEFANATYSL